MKTFKAVTTQKLTALVCDGCGLEAKADDYEFHEFISVNQRCGYCSIHGDGKNIETDLCQQCFTDMCGDTLRVTDESNVSTEYSESSDKEQLEYSNIFDVICQSKAKAGQLKANCDLRLTVREILLKNKISNNNELTAALKLVEQLWDAQHQSLEGNELHQLADLICAYGKKDWNSFFDEVQLEDDDFMPGRLNFKSKFTFNEKQADSDTLKKVFTNKNIDEAKQYLFETIESVQLKHPELRLGQLLINAMNLQRPCPELYHIEDNVLAEKLNELSNSVSS